LIKEYNWGAAYVWIYIGLGILAVIFSSGAGYVLFRAAVPGAPAGAGWEPLAVRRPLRARVKVNFVQGVVYLCIWGWAAWHYFARFPPPHGFGGNLVTWGVGLPGVWYLVSAARAYFTRRAVSDARVAVLAGSLRVGGEARVRVEQELLGEAVLERVRVGLVCEKATGSGKHRTTEVHWQGWATPAVPVGPSDAGGGRERRVSITQVLRIPDDVPASESSGDPRYAWKLVVETALAECPDYREEFEIRVRAGGETEIGTNA
jgi:hypothetical protein